MNRYGDTPLGMVESALEFARIARENDYHEFVFSMKSSNPKVMIEAYRLLVARLNEAGPDWNYPIHLGVTEAGDGEDGRIKSAIGIGSLLSDGVGDTIRVSLTEDSVHEIPVAQALVKRAEAFDRSVGSDGSVQSNGIELSYDPFSYKRRGTSRIERNAVGIGSEELIRVGISQVNFDKISHKLSQMGDYQPEFISETAQIRAVNPTDDAAIAAVNAETEPQFVTVSDETQLPVIAAYRLLASKLQARHPILLKDQFNNGTLRPASEVGFLESLLIAATNIGSLLCDGIGDAVLIQGEDAPGQAMRLSYNILQAAGSRIFKTDYVACPSCGRTLFNLQTTTAKIKASTNHLKGVKIAIMGCIVNGPGEMADADFGYVGGAPGKVNLYVGKTPVKFNIPEDEAVDRLKDLIAEHGKWVEPAV